ncbi:MAG: GGDEF domain-containing protein [Clostridiaceae bacterium]|nr:GGDEF domain-containing protein [Clostridiaceae bacterium]
MLILILIVFSGINIYLFQRHIRLVEGDVGIINQLGTIRGSIQRFVKLELAKGDNEHIKDTIDNIFDAQKKLDTPYLAEAEKYWEELKLIAKLYRNNPSDYYRKLLVGRSEECWESIDLAIQKNQSIAENKVNNLVLPLVFLILMLVFAVILIFITKKYVYDNLETFAAYDNLTKAHSRRYFIEYTKNEIARAERKNTEFALIMFDIDYFKSINDTYGHSVGDEVLKTLVEIVRKDLRKSDVLARIGGEEFAVLLPDATIWSAVTTAERARKNIEKHYFKGIGNITVSFGVTSYQEGDKVEDLMKRADTALYMAKNGGRNRTETA